MITADAEKTFGRVCVGMTEERRCDHESNAGIASAPNPSPNWRGDLAHALVCSANPRDEACSGSDVDIVVSFDGPATSQRYFGVQFYLEDLLGLPGRSGD